jgi:hypothetical protein
MKSRRIGGNADSFYGLINLANVLTGERLMM